MRKWRVIIWSMIAVAIIVCSGVISGCQKPDTGTGKTGSTLGSDVGTGKIAGVVTDSEISLPKGAAAQKYQGASISIHQAVEAGTYKLAEGLPEMKNYDVGDLVREVTSGKDGYWEVELPSGKYFIRAFLGERVYSGDIFVKVKKGETVKLDIKLISGV